jgi:hypothetical protein
MELVMSLVGRPFVSPGVSVSPGVDNGMMMSPSLSFERYKSGGQQSAIVLREANDT